MRLKIFALALLSSFALFAAPGSATAGPEVIFPLSASLPFPWGRIEGLWRTADDDLDATFSFEVQGTDKTGRKILKVVHLDPYTYEVIAEGLGVMIDGYPVVRAAMKGKDESYFLIIGSYENRDLSRGPARVTVLSKYPFFSNYTEVTQTIVRKFSNVPLRLTTPHPAKK